MKRTILVLSSVLITGISPALVSGGDGAGWEADLQSYLGRVAEALNVPGAVVVVVTREDGTTVLTHGVRCLDGADPVTSQTSFEIASLTKAFTATTAADLVGEGIIEWDTTARALIPDLELADPVATELVTLRDLLAHRSGLAENNLLHLNIDAPPAWILPRLAVVEPAGDFRDRFIYSGLGYIVAGEMLGRADESSWTNAVSKRLLDPLGMTSTTVGPPVDPRAETACGHLRWSGSMVAVEPLVLSVAAPAMGLYSTPDDLTRWLELLVGEGEVDGQRIVDGMALRETWTPQVVMRRSGSQLRAYGFGWYLSNWRGRRHLSHDGGGAGFTGQVRFFPEAGVAIAALANVAVSGLPDVVAERASELVFGEEIQRGVLEMVVKMSARIEALHEAPRAALRATADPGAPPSLDLPAYAGCYSNPAFGELEIRVEGDAVHAMFHGIDHAVEHLHDDVFMLSSIYTGDQEAVFTVDGESVSSVAVPLGNPEDERVFVDAHCRGE